MNLVLVYLFAFPIQVAYAIWYLWAMGGSKMKTTEKYVSKPMSIIICAKNENQKISQNRPFILVQDCQFFK